MRREDVLQYQRELPEKDLTRDFSQSAAWLYPAVALQEEIEERLMRAVYGSEVVVVDGGCGSGAAIENIARVMPFVVQDGCDFRSRLKAIGIDLNPLPNMIPRRILEINPEDGCNGIYGQVFDCVADLREDDLETLATLPDKSVDIFYSVAGFNAVVDVLQGLTNVVRVLKDDGLGVINTPRFFLTEPDIAQIIQQTPGAENIFELHTHESSYPRRTREDFLLVRPERRRNFKGFPFKLVGSKPMAGQWEAWHSHIRIGVYESV